MHYRISLKEKLNLGAFPGLCHWEDRAYGRQGTYPTLSGKLILPLWANRNGIRILRATLKEIMYFSMRMKAKRDKMDTVMMILSNTTIMKWKMNRLLLAVVAKCTTTRRKWYRFLDMGCSIWGEWNSKGHLCWNGVCKTLNQRTGKKGVWNLFGVFGNA